MNYHALAEKKWQVVRAEYPTVAEQLDELDISDEEMSLRKILCAGLEIRDLVSLKAEEMLAYVRASMKARREIYYASQVPDDLFLDYVLPFRINNEYPDGSRGWLYEQIKNRVQGKSMLDAALEVNYWCLEHATYQSTDDRTISPRGMCRRAKGRCGEESTLLVCALRAVGIPARQVYVPYWTHCDDNHAWVEFWAEGQWYYMGACEPEPVPNIGWFQSAASRAMLVRSRVPDLRSACGYRTVNSTALYADTAILKVTVRREGKTAPDVQVRFQIINESRLVTLHTETSDQHGQVCFETGLGSLIVSTYLDGRLIEQQVDLRKSCETVLNWEDGFDPLTQEVSTVLELIPPAEKLPQYYEPSESHKQRLKLCDEIRIAYEHTFSAENQWLNMARGNYAEIEKFLKFGLFSLEDKEALLSLLAEKDMADVTCKTLVDYLAESLRWKGNYPREIWQNQILAPRVENEMLLPIRSKIRRILKEYSLKSRDEVRVWMKQNLRSVPDYGLTERRGNAAQYVRHRVCPESEWDILTVQICRSIGIPAAIDEKPDRSCSLTVKTDEPLRWRENWTLSRWEAGEYRLIELPIETLKPGSYQLITSRRQIDGTVSAEVRHFILTKDREICVRLQPDRTAEKLRSVPLPEVAQSVNKPSLLLFLQPGAEPTEHLLLELLELKDELNRGQWPVLMLLQEEHQAENPTFRQALQELQFSSLGRFSPEEQYRIQTAMGIGDARLPLAVVLNGAGCGVYACANYNIRSVHTMLRILNMISK